MLRFSNVTKHFADGTRALGRVSLVIPRGQFCVILGPSGAGKSTLLRTVNGLVPPSDGTVSVEGTQVAAPSLRDVRQRIGMIHQQFNLVERSTVLTNVLTGALATVPLWRVLAHMYPEELRRKAARLLQEVGLDAAHLNRRVTELSGGQQQRVGIARAFILDPAVVLADEPVASLDPKTSRDILGLIKQASQHHGATVLCTLHQIELAREFADRVVALRGGEIVFDGSPKDLDTGTLNMVFGSYQARPVLMPAPATLMPEASPA